MVRPPRKPTEDPRNKLNRESNKSAAGTKTPAALTFSLPVFSLDGKGLGLF